MVKKSGVTIKNDNSDFEHLKAWQNNPDLGYYRSEKHWNVNVNIALYRLLSQFYETIGVYEYLGRPLASNRDLFYGCLLNEAYRLCHIVLTSDVPDAMLAHLFDEAETLIIRDWKIPAGCRPPQPNIIDRILSYHILGMVNAILSFANNQEESIDRFLYDLSLYNDEEDKYKGKYQSFKTYYKAYEQFVVVGLIFSSALRPGYDYKGKDNHLRKKILWYKLIAEELEEKRELNKGQQYLKQMEEGRVVVETESIVTQQQQPKDDTAEIPPLTSHIPQSPKDSGQEEFEEWDDTYDSIFDKRVRPKEIKRAMETVKSEKIKDRRFYYVAYRILKIIKWIPIEVSESEYMRWINCHFECGWEKNKNQKKAFLFNLEGYVKKLDDLHPSEWKDDSIYGKLGKHYRLLAISFKNAFTYTMIDKKPVEDSESYEHLRDRLEFLSGARNYFGLLSAPDEAYINDGK